MSRGRGGSRQPAQEPGPAVVVTWRLRRTWRAVALLARVARYVARAEGFHRGRLSVVVVGRRAMATLHERYLGVAGPTDVLTFDLGTDRRRGLLDGEVFVGAEAALRRARRTADRPAGVPAAARAELALYVTHGVLHLAGYDDRAPAGFRRMHAREDELLARLGFGPVFDRGA